MKKIQSGKTWRKTYDGKKVIEGDWCRKCDSLNCPHCETGIYKGRLTGKIRRDEKSEIQRQLLDIL